MTRRRTGARWCTTELAGAGAPLELKLVRRSHIACSIPLLCISLSKHSVYHKKASSGRQRLRTFTAASMWAMAGICSRRSSAAPDARFRFSP